MGNRAAESFFQRPSVALANLIYGDFGGAGRALFNPESLTPSEGRTLSERAGVSGLLGGVLDNITDPIIFLSAITSFVHKPPKAIRYLEGGEGKWVSEDAFKIGEKFRRDQERFPSFLSPIRSAHANFAGTGVDETMSLLGATKTLFQHKYITKIGDAGAAYAKRAGKPMDHATEVLAFAALERLDSKAVYGFKDKLPNVFTHLPKDPAFKSLVKDYRAAYDEAWDEIFADPRNRDSILSALKGIQKMGSGARKSMAGMLGRDRIGKLPATDDMQAWELAIKEYFKKHNDYMPHTPTRDLYFLNEAVQEAKDRERVFTGLDSLSEEGYARSVKAAATTNVMGGAFKRQGRMLPAIADLELAGVMPYINPKALQQIKDKMSISASQISAGKTPDVMEYSMRLVDVTSGYIHQASSMKAWTLEGYGDKMVQHLEDLTKAGDHVRARTLASVYMPALMGKMSYKQAIRGQVWATRLSSMSDGLEGLYKKGFVGKRTKNFLQGLMMDSRGQFSGDPIQRRLAGLIYTGALGANVGASVKNLFQIVLTAGPLLGPEYTAIGIQKAMQKSGKYFELRYGKEKLSHNKAVMMAFPEYYSTGISASPIIDETIGRHLSTAYERVGSLQLSGNAEKAGAVWDQVQQGLMQVFSLSENAVRFSTFEGAYAKGMASSKAAARAIGRKGIKVPLAAQREDALKYAGRMVEETQFVSGVANTPQFLVDKGPLARQFGHFPARYLEYLTHTTQRYGSAQIEKGGKNWGSLARAVLWAEVAGKGGYELGENLDDSLMSGALPGFRTWGAFAPMPWVPPILTLGASPFMDLANQDLDFPETRRSLPLLVPGGVALSRMAAAFPVPGNEAIAAATMKPYVDYNNPTPDGRYPSFTTKGNLIGYLSTEEITRMGMGVFGKGGTLNKEKDLYRSMLQNRDQIRQYKKDYIQRTMRGDLSSAKEIDSEFEGRFPEVGSIKNMISEKDFKRYRTLRELTRAEKLLDTMPPEARGIYAQALETAMLEMGPEFFGMQQGGFTGGETAKARQPWRLPSGFHYSETMSPLGNKTEGRDVSGGRYAPKIPFSSFGSFSSGEF